MSPKEEKKLLFVRRTKYFLTVLGVYIGVYLVLYLLLSLIHAVVYLHPYIRIAALLGFFVIDTVVTNRIMALPAVRSFTEI